MDIERTAPYSYRQDINVPDFDDRYSIVFMDGECALCSRSARMIARLDRKQKFKICPIQTSLGQSILSHFGLDPSDPDSWLYLTDGKAYTSMDAIIRAGWNIGGIGRLPVLLRILPRFLQDGLYNIIARNRFRIAGRTEICNLPDPELRKRLIQ